MRNWRSSLYSIYYQKVTNCHLSNRLEFDIIWQMVQENTDQSTKNTATATAGHVNGGTSGPTPATPRVRLPDEPGKPKRRRRRRPRHRNKNTSKVPDSVAEDQQKLQAEAKKQQEARLGSLEQELKAETPSKTDSEDEKSAPAVDKPEEKSAPVTLPELKVNGKPYRPDKTADKKIRTALAGKDKQSPPKKTTAESPILSAMLSQKEADLESRQLEIAKPERREQVTTKEAKKERQPEIEPAENADNTVKTAKRFTPHVDAGGMGTAPTFSLQDIQRARRRRRLLIMSVLVILLAAGWLFWAGLQKARRGIEQKVAEYQSQASPTSVPASESGQKATLSGRVVTNGLQFPSVTLDRIAIYIRYDGEESFRDTGIRLMDGEDTWIFSQANDGMNYEIQAVLLDNGRELAASNVVTASAPAANVELVFPPGSELVSEVPRPEPKNEPVLQLDEAPSISGVVTIQGQLPNMTQIVIWLGENTGAEQIRQDAYSFLLSGSEIAYTISDLDANAEYVVDAVVMDSQGNALATADRTMIVRPGATNVNFTISLTM